jgi:hypothetical protein
MIVPAVVALAMLFATGTAASAQNRTDVVTLLNGDRITGEITGLERGRLELKTDDAGTIDIEWDNVAGVEAARGFEVETEDGRRLLGSLSRLPDSQRVQLTAPEGVVPLTMSEITRITPIGASFWTRLDGSLDAGFTYSQSSGIAQTTLNSSTLFRRPDFQIRLAGSATLTAHDDGTERDDRGSAELAYVRYRGRRWFMSGAARFDNNESLGLTLRSQLGGLAGQRLVNTNRAQLELGAGLVVNDERAVDAESTQNVEALLGLKASYYTYDRPKTQLDFSVQYYPSLSNWGRQRLQLDTAIKREVWKDFFLSLNVYDTFDSAPPQPESARNDVGVSFSLGWSY